MTLFTILLIAAIIFAFLAAFNVPARVNWLGLSLASYFIGLLLQGHVLP